MAEDTVSIRIARSEWKAFKEVADSLGMSRNELIRLFIRSILAGKTQIEQRNNIMNVNINLVPISNTNVMISQTKMLKNRLILDEMRKNIDLAYKSLNNTGKIPYGIKNNLEKLLNRATYIPPDLFEEAEKIILT